MSSYYNKNRSALRSCELMLSYVLFYSVGVCFQKSVSGSLIIISEKVHVITEKIMVLL